MSDVVAEEVRMNRVALVETVDPYPTIVHCIALLDAGYDVVVCAGAQSDQLCPAIDGLPCPLIREADIVINAVRDPVTQSAIVDGIRTYAPDVPIAVIAATPTAVGEGCVRYGDIADLGRQLGRTSRRRPRTAHCERTGVEHRSSADPRIGVVP